MFSRRKILSIYIPILIDQAFLALVGIVSTIMVNSVGEFAVSGVGLVDSINLLVINVLNAVATGATIIVSQALGNNDLKRAAHTGSQALTLATLGTAAAALIMLLLRHMIISFLFGGAEQNVLAAAGIYLVGSCAAYPFVAVTSVIAGILRAAGDNRNPMLASIIANIVNIIVSSVLIFGFHLGVYGAAAGLVAARAASSVYLYLYLKSGDGLILTIRPSFKFSRDIIGGLLRISVPSAVDSAIFNGGKILVQVFLAGMGTTAISANVIGLSLHNLIILPANAFAIASVPIIGFIYGSGDKPGVLKNMKRLTFYTAGIQLVMSLIFIILAGPLVSIYNPSPETAAAAKTLTVISACVLPFLWPGAFLTANTLRAAGDVKYTMYGSVVSMILLRIIGAWFFGVYMNLGVIGVWISMFCDWGGRSLAFIPRAFGGFWDKRKTGQD